MLLFPMRKLILIDINKICEIVGSHARVKMAESFGVNTVSCFRFPKTRKKNQSC